MRARASVQPSGVLALIISLAVLACEGASARADDSSVPADSSASASQDSSQPGWVVLFDGSSTAAWRGFQRSDLPSGWQIVDGALTRVSEGGDIITREQFGDFELELEWNVAPRGNSGIMFRVTEEDSSTYRTGPEMQVLDDAGHADGKSRLTAAGSNYALHAATAGVVKPAGEWNQARLVVRGPHVEHWLNGQKVVEYELWSPQWEALVKASKFVQWPRYGRAQRGHIALQDHGDRVAFRNIRIRSR
jgi:hypothetical protein